MAEASTQGQNLADKAKNVGLRRNTAAKCLDISNDRLLTLKAVYYSRFHQ